MGEKYEEVHNRILMMLSGLIDTLHSLVFGETCLTAWYEQYKMDINDMIEEINKEIKK